MHFLKQIFSDRVEEWVHQRFVRYSKGTFDGPALNAKISGKTLKVNASADYCNALGGTIAKNSNETFSVSGKIISKEDLSPIGKCRKKKGFFILEISKEMSSAELLDVYKKFPDSFALLNLSKGVWKLKCKKNLPKPGSSVDDQFCNAILDLVALDDFMNEILFDMNKKDFKEVSVQHIYEISGIVIPEECKKDPAKARLLAKRKGKIKRILTVDGKKTETEHALLI